MLLHASGQGLLKRTEANGREAIRDGDDCARSSRKGLVELKRHCNPPLLQLSVCKVREIWDFDVIVSDMINLCHKNGNAKVVFGDCGTQF